MTISSESRLVYFDRMEETVKRAKSLAAGIIRRSKDETLLKLKEEGATTG